MLKEEYSQKITLNAISIGIILPLLLIFYLYPHNLTGFRLFIIKFIFIIALGYISFDIFNSTQNLEITNFTTCKILMYIFSILLFLLAIQILFTTNRTTH